MVAFVCRILLVCAGVTLHTYAAGVYTLRNGMTDWKSPDSYIENAVPTLSTDVIVTERNASNRICADAPTYDAAFEMMNLVSKVALGQDSVLEIEVPSGCRTITGRILCGDDDQPKRSGTLVKIGDGKLFQEPTTIVDGDRYAKWVVKAGTLGAPWSLSQEGGRMNISACGLHVEEGAHFISSHSAFLRILCYFTGKGSVSTLNPSRQSSCLYIVGGPSDYEGEIGTNLIIYVRGGAVNFLGTENKFDGNLFVCGFKNDGTDAGILGFMKFGADVSDDSSLGRRGTITLGAYGEPGAIRYLGTVSETVVSKSIFFENSTSAPCMIDAGAFGGLVFSSGVQWKIGSASGNHQNQRICLTGSNVAECAFSGKFLPENGCRDCNFYLTKKGTGAWRLNGNPSSEFSGPIRIDEGTLRYDTLAGKGEPCALGTATRLFDDVCVAPMEETSVDYAMLFGGIGKGTLEYCGEFAAASFDRPIAVKTGGGLSSATKATRIHGIAAYDHVDAVSELVLLATNDAICTYADISDGDHGGRLGITKRGGGTVELDRNLTFSGPLKVEAGRLIVRNSSGQYTWFRLIVKQNAAGLENVSSVSDCNHVIVERFALYDADGLRQNIGLSRHCGNLNDSYSGGHVIGAAAWCVRPGEVAYDRVGKVSCWTTRDIENMCDVVNGNAKMCYTRYDTGKPLSPDVPESWVRYVFRLPDGSQTIASWDIATRFGGNTTGGNQYRAPTMMELQGSVDGIVWDSLTNYVNSTPKTIVGGMWYSDQKTDCYFTRDGRRWQDGKSFPIKGAPETPVEFSVLGNCESVEVAPGAELIKAGAHPITIYGLKVSKNGFGKIDGFTFSSDPRCVLTVEGEMPNGAFTIPGQLVNVDVSPLSQWSVRAGCKTGSRYRMAAMESGIRIWPIGMLVTIR